MTLNFAHRPQHVADFSTQLLFAVEKYIPVSVRCLIALVYKLGIGADLGVVALDKLEKPQDRALIHPAEHKG